MSECSGRVLVIGGINSLGKALIPKLEATGFIPVVTSRSPDEVARFNLDASSIGEGRRAAVLRFDSEEVFRGDLEAILAEQEIGGLVYSAYARLPYCAMGTVPVGHWEQSARVSLWGLETASARIAEGKRAQQKMSIVAVSSIYAFRAPRFDMYSANMNPNPVYYGAMKAGTMAIVRYMAARWGGMGVRVNSVSPGGILADQDPSFLKRYDAGVPTGRMVTPEEVSGAVAFLLSEASSGFNGADLVIDGGRTIW